MNFARVCSVIVVIVGGVLASFGSATAPQWEKEGATAADADLAKQQCSYEVKLHNGGKTNWDLVYECLKARGFRERK